MDGNVSREGVLRDLEWLKAIGIGGVQMFDGALSTPQVVPERAPFLSEPWRQNVRQAVETAGSLGLEFTIASSPGWSQTGGPWVRPEQAMKKLVWSEARVSGGERVRLRLPQPPSTSGPFQDVPGGGAEPSAPPPPDLPTLYRDSRVVAYRVRRAPLPPPHITASSPVDPSRLTNGDRTDFQPLDMRPGQAWIEFAYDSPQPLCAAEIVLQPGTRVGPIYPSWPVGRIEAADDAGVFRMLAILPERGAPQQTIAFAETITRRIRLVLEPRFAAFPVEAFAPSAGPVDEHRIAHIAFTNEPRVHRFEDKAGWSTVPGLGLETTPDASPGATIAPEEVVDLTPQMTADGLLEWQSPPGEWRVLRLGWSLTGKLNNPASVEGTGLEVDKLNGAHVSAYLKEYLAVYEAAVGAEGFGANGISHLLNDSYEAMAANWTEAILDQFQARRGYDPLPWLPVLTGKVVRSADSSDRFLWDFRRTLADLLADEHYGVLTRELHAGGLGRYGESHEALRAFVGDGMEVKKSADVPMGATWAMSGLPQRLPDLLESASVAHLYGQNVVAAESFTTIASPYGFDPASLKPYADRMMANGVNRFVIHTSVHQPDDSHGPGVTLGPVGQWFTRKETWADMAGAWIDYLARSSELLQRGRNIADIAIFYGEDDNLTAVYADRQPSVPQGFGFDFVNSDALRSLLTVSGGRLTAPRGAAYRVLALEDAARRITLATLRRLDEFSRQGLVIAGGRPTGSPSLADDEAEVERLLDSVWGRPNTFGELDEAIASLGLEPDVVLGSPDLAFVHRSSAEEEIYFVANLADRPVQTKGSFRLAGRTPEIWRADIGSRRLARGEVHNGRTIVDLSLDPNDAVFVVFRDPTPERRFDPPAARVELVGVLDGPWWVDFGVDTQTSARVRFERLESWTESGRPEVRYFSGVARYRRPVRLPRVEYGERLLLDFGAVANVAEVFLNGVSLGVAWKSPFRIDLTRRARAGWNELEVAVANLWPNRLIGDRQPVRGRPPAATTYNPFEADSRLAPAGLLGPVHLLRERTA